MLGEAIQRDNGGVAFYWVGWFLVFNRRRLKRDLSGSRECYGEDEKKQCKGAKHGSGRVGDVMRIVVVRWAVRKNGRHDER